MRILYDYQIFQMQNFGGISRYFFELMRNSAEAGYDYELSLLLTANEYLADNQNISKSIQIPPTLQRKLYRITNKLNLEFSKMKIRKSEFDVFHPTFFETYFIEQLKKPYVLTVYDLINENFPEYFQNNSAFIEKKRILMKNASKIISISENTKHDIMKYYSIASEKIEVTYLAESISNLQSSAPCKLPEKYILFIGKREDYKNFQNCYQAIKKILMQDPTLNLVCAGGFSFNRTELAQFQEDNLSQQVHFIPFQKNEHLKFLYEKALCFIFPSLYEGFGIPVLEAFASSCPICLSNSSSLSEIAGAAAIYFDPKSIAEIFSAVQKALDSSKRRYYTDLGLQQLTKFSWKKTTKQTLDVYKKC